jgi:GDP-4-dehydro-6-deoxy-D-mannose reductase
MKAFITGIAGFAGAHLAEHLLDSGDDVCGASLGGTWTNGAGPDALPAQVTALPIHTWDVGEPCPAELVDALTKFAPTVIFHLAAISKATSCGKTDPTPEALRINVQGTEHVLALAARLPSQPRVLLVSSSYVYGPAHEEGETFAESSPLVPTNGYGHTKLAAEERVAQAIAAHNIDAVIARAFQHSGPRQDKQFMLAEWCQQFATNSDAPVAMHNSHAWIDLSDVRDVVRAYRVLAERGACGEAYNVGSGVARTSGDIFTQLLQMADPSRLIEIRSTASKYGPIADLHKISSELGWHPRIPLAETLRDTLEWFGGNARGANAG